MNGYVIDVRHGHDWEYLPTLATNPEIRTRVCRICGERQVSEGETIVVNGPSIPPTDWRMEPAP